jgi:hypothetical protein
MSLKPTVVRVDATENGWIVSGTLATAGTIPSTGNGEILDLTTFGTGPVPFPPVTSLPYFMDVYEAPAAGTSASGYCYNFAPGTTLKNSKVQVFQSAGSAAPLAQITNTAWATIAPQNLSFIAFFSKRGV